jgi:arylsulfatase A-like enzyme
LPGCADLHQKESMRNLRFALTALFLLLYGVAAAAQQPLPAGSPRLVVVITVDQLRGDYLDRYAGNLTGGFARFRGEGAYFPGGRQDHALTTTAPGHASVLSGRVPARTNILTNDHGVPDPVRPLIAGARGGGASPWRFHGTTLLDWMISADAETRSLSVARKDRGAILPAGAARTHVYWWGHDRFTTSTWYRDTLPSWVSAFNAELQEQAWDGREWNLLLPPQAYPEPDDQPFEGVGAGRGYLFPHRMESILQLTDFPWMDSVTLALALRGARETGLGRRTGTDLLLVSLSTLDAIGHDFGPDSREVHDHVVRIDRWLGAFMQQLEAEHGAAAIMWVLTSDHGVGPMPQFLQARGETDAGRIVLRTAIGPVMAELQRRHAHNFGLELQSGVLLADTIALRSRGLDVAALGAELAARMSELPGVARTFTPASLAAAPADDEDARLWRRSIPAGYGWLVLAQPRDGWVLTSSGKAEHGTPLADNISVPIAFLGRDVPRLRVERPVNTVDIAPTLAALLGISPTEPLDGVVLPEVVASPIHAVEAQ